MSSFTNIDSDSLLKIEYVQDFVAISGGRTGSLFAAVTIQTVQLKDLIERINRKVATALQVSRSLNNIRADLPYYKGRIQMMDMDSSVQKNELGHPVPIDCPKNTLANLKDLIKKLEEPLPELNEELTKLENAEREQREQQGKTVFAFIAFVVVGVIALHTFRRY